MVRAIASDLRISQSVEGLGLVSF